MTTKINKSEPAKQEPLQSRPDVYENMDPVVAEHLAYEMDGYFNKNQEIENSAEWAVKAIDQTIDDRTDPLLQKMGLTPKVSEQTVAGMELAKNGILSESKRQIKTNDQEAERAVEGKYFDLTGKVLNPMGKSPNEPVGPNQKPDQPLVHKAAIASDGSTHSATFRGEKQLTAFRRIG